MITLAQLTGAHRETYQEILAANLRRTAVRALLAALGHVSITPEDRLHVTRNGHVLLLPRSSAKKVESKTTVVALRRFLKRSELPVIHFHSFRKTFRAFGVHYGINPRSVQEILGHSDANLTAKAYTDVPALALHDEIRKLPWLGNDTPI
ncbi:MAG: tyrosine-type recombinase/integrase [Candidatus Synoicihabitans palmerolidicus]|nr:tyrosine-type recombinase/integrase [Candidatus Synoicihabitans palmerolidicus]